eukprot:TRINITY_DN4041_c0_g1_i2.p1 TRINITY_DN4041_c0_g1~~TRINITY_DN4041_c0_g1_i2.p1  ORF type:complete len:219 (+),score=60.39 TRINITY_DN4041_c0_g1_i2:41-697(+)
MEDDNMDMIEKEDIEEDIEENEDPTFSQLTPNQMNNGKSDYRAIPVPTHRLGPLKSEWTKMVTPLIEHCKLQVRFNIQTKKVELKTSQYTKEVGSLQKGEDYVKAFLLGFELKDCIALLRLEELYVDSFNILDVKQVLKGDNLSRAIGRIVGTDGQTKFAIENTTRTRIVVADKRVHILGSYHNIQITKDALFSLILGSPAGKVYNKLRNIMGRIKDN